MAAQQPSRPRRTPPKPTSAFMTAAVIAVILAVLVVLGLLQLARNPNVKNQLGEPVFVAGRAKDLSNEISQRGPSLFQALVGNRDIYLQHLGSDPLTNWLSMEAHAPHAPRRCVLQWLGASDQAPGHFRDPCDGHTYPADGSGLVRFSTTVEQSTSRVVVNLRQTLP